MTSFTRLHQGIARLKANWIYVLQAGFAAGLSYWFALTVLGHAQPFFAPMATVIVLSTTGGERFRRSCELVAGVSIGVGLGDVLIALVGTGTWQIAVAVAASIALGTLVDKGVLVANQASFAAVLIATILPPGTSGGFDRMTDALVGGVVGLIVMSIFPESPLRSGQREIAKILGLTADVQKRVVRGLKEQDPDTLASALMVARGSQAGINTMIAAANYGKENMRFSPLLWRKRQHLHTMMRILNPVDNAMRDTRVLARKALVLTEDHESATPQQIELLTELSATTAALSEVFYQTADLQSSPQLHTLIRSLEEVSARATLDVAGGGGLSTHAVLAQTRSLCVDLLQICGYSRRQAIAALVPVAEAPASPHSVWNDGE